MEILVEMGVTEETIMGEMDLMEVLVQGLLQVQAVQVVDKIVGIMTHLMEMVEV